jgi:PAS domain S-box-containing protein
MVSLNDGFPPDPPESLLDILDRLGVGFYRSDGESRIRFINKAGAAIYGCTPEEMTAGLHTYDFDPRGFDRTALRRQVENENLIGSFVSPGIKRDGTKIYTTSTVRCLHREDGTLVGFEGVFRDTTDEVLHVREQIALVGEVQTVNARLMRISALQDQLLSSLAHDLVTPPVVMQGFTELLLKGRYGAIAPEQEKPIRTIHRNVHLLSALVGELLEFTRFLKIIHASEAGSSLLGGAWRAVTHELSEQSKARQVAFALSPDFCNPEVKVSSAILHPILENIALNAVDLSGKGSTITASIHASQGRVTLDTALERLNPEHPPLDRILDRFFPEPGELNAPEGVRSGLGLAAARYAANLVGGDLDCSALGGNGLALRLHLPP